MGPFLDYRAPGGRAPAALMPQRDDGVSVGDEGMGFKHLELEVSADQCEELRNTISPVACAGKRDAGGSTPRRRSASRARLGYPHARPPHRFAVRHLYSFGRSLRVTPVLSELVRYAQLVQIQGPSFASSSSLGENTLMSRRQ